jgi:hypothetical protein
LECWSVGVLECWSVGVLEYWRRSAPWLLGFLPQDTSIFVRQEKELAISYHLGRDIVFSSNMSSPSLINLRPFLVTVLELAKRQRACRAWRITVPKETRLS